MKHINPVALSIAACVIASQAAPGQVDSVTIELDQYWAEVSRTVADGDFEAMKATYHPDAVWVSGDADSYRTLLMTEALAAVEAGVAETRAGIKTPGVEFRFSSRVHDANTAHEVGLSHYWVIRDGQREDFYGLLDTYLVKKDGRWMALVEIQRGQVTETEWNQVASNDP